MATRSPRRNSPAKRRLPQTPRQPPRSLLRSTTIQSLQRQADGTARNVGVVPDGHGRAVQKRLTFSDRLEAMSLNMLIRATEINKLRERNDQLTGELRATQQSLEAALGERGAMQTAHLSTVRECDQLRAQAIADAASWRETLDKAVQEKRQSDFKMVAFQAAQVQLQAHLDDAVAAMRPLECEVAQLRAENADLRRRMATVTAAIPLQQQQQQQQQRIPAAESNEGAACRNQQMAAPHNAAVAECQYWQQRFFLSLCLSIKLSAALEGVSSDRLNAFEPHILLQEAQRAGIEPAAWPAWLARQFRALC